MLQASVAPSVKWGKPFPTPSHRNSENQQLRACKGSRAREIKSPSESLCAFPAPEMRQCGCHQLDLLPHLTPGKWFPQSLKERRNGNYFSPQDSELGLWPTYFYLISESKILRPPHPHTRGKTGAILTPKSLSLPLSLDMTLHRAGGVCMPRSKNHGPPASLGPWQVPRVPKVPHAAPAPSHRVTDHSRARGRVP